MKRIEFIAPVEAIRGNLSGNQDLKYGANAGKAYDQEVGKVTAANNYDPRFVGAKRSRDGFKYFQVRTKSAVGLTSKSKKAMALLAGSAACFLAASKNLAIISQLQIAFVEAKASDPSLTFRKWLQGIMYEMLAEVQKSVTIAVPNLTDVVINNPWTMGTYGGTNLNVSREILVKFGDELADPKIHKLTIGGMPFVTTDGVSGTTANNVIWSGQQLLQKYNSEPVNGYPYYRLQPDLMDPDHRMILQYIETDGGGVTSAKVITLNGEPVGAGSEPIDGASYGLADLS